MRILNEELKKRILQIAVEEFYNNGFEKASLRKIVRKAGTTIGNFYNYFKSKEDLYYCITDPIYNSLLYYLKYHNDDDVFKLDMPITIEKSKLIIEDMLANLIDYEKPFIILLTSSKGTKYSDVQNNLTQVFAEHLEDHLKESVIYKDITITKLLATSLANGFLEGALYILKKSANRKETLESMTNFVIVYFIGMLNIPLE